MSNHKMFESYYDFNGYDYAVYNDTISILKKIISSLFKGYNSERNAKILLLRYGLLNGCPMTLSEIAKKFNVSSETVRQVVCRGTRKLRKPSNLSLLGCRVIKKYSIPFPQSTKINVTLKIVFA